MKTTFTLFLLVIISVSGVAQEVEPITRELRSFNKIIASPKINVILRKGDREAVEVKYSNVSGNKINVEVSGKTLHIYLDGARNIEKSINNEYNHQYRSMYHDASVTAYVTYKNLEGLEIRGDQELTCYDPIESEEFFLRAYGENEITLASLTTEYFRVAMYGENKLKIKAGKVIEQRYKLYGENDINTTEMKSAYTSTSIFGEGALRVHSAKEVRVSAFGEPIIHVEGGGKVSRRLVVGNTRIRTLN